LEESLNSFFCKNKDNEIKVRLLLLKRYNDIIRKEENRKRTKEETEAFIKNNSSLIELHKNATSTNERIFLAELYREKGDFDSCINVLINVSADKAEQKDTRDKIYAMARLKYDKVFNISTCAPRKESKCNICKDSIIVFDLDKINHPLDYKLYICKSENTVFNSPSKEENPKLHNKARFFIIPAKSKKAHERYIERKVITCPYCKSKDVALFFPEIHNCISCGVGKYEIVEWFPSGSDLNKN